MVGVVSGAAISCRALSVPVVVVKGSDYSDKMHYRRNHYKDMKDLMRRSPYVKCAWLDALGKSCLVIVSAW